MAGTERTGRVAFAIAAHPDDIEFMMAGTMLLLAEAGYELHYMNLATGNCGSTVYSSEETERVRRGEAEAAAARLGATFHPPLAPDLEILYELPTLRRLAAVVREVEPDVMLLQSPQDYMEDHMNSSRLGVSAGFTRGMPNFATEPPTPPTTKPVCLYHALPWGLRDQLCLPVVPEFVVDIATTLDRKTEVLACHRSQRDWLDESQALDSYLVTMREMAAQVGAPYGVAAAEGWRRHNPLGFCEEGFDPLRSALAARITENPQYPSRA